jgi:hypothetical protein
VNNESSLPSNSCTLIGRNVEFCLIFLRAEEDNDDFLLLSFANFLLLGVLVNLLFLLLGVLVDLFVSFMISLAAALSEDFFFVANFFVLVLSFFVGAIIGCNFWIN